MDRRRATTMLYNNDIAGGASALLYQDRQDDLVNWLDNPAPTPQEHLQGFREGAKETYPPPSSYPLPLAASNWSPVYSDDFDDLLGADLSSENLDDCLSLNMKDENWHRKLSGDDAKWAAQVSRDYQQFKQQKRMSRGQLDDLHAGQQYTDDAGYLSSEQTDSPPYQVTYQGGYSSPPSVPRSSVSNSPFSEAYNSPEYQNFYTPDQSIRQDNDWDLNELDEDEIKSIMESVSLPTSPNGQQCVETSGNYNVNDFESIYRIVCENSLNDAAPSETKLEIGSPYENENICYENSTPETSYSSSAYEEQNTVLKDVISEEGDSILQDLISPIKQGDGSQITACYMTSSYADPLVGTSQQVKITKRVPFTAEERRLRKKEQNKRAAVKYREKKKTEVDYETDRYDEAVNRNKALKERKRAALAEFDVIRSLLMEKLQSRG